MARIPIARTVAERIREAAEQPAEIKPVRPIRDADLVAAQEGDGGADTMNGHRIVKTALEIKTQALLRTAPDGYDYMFGTTLAESVQEIPIFNLPAVQGSDVGVVFGYRES